MVKKNTKVPNVPVDFQYYIDKATDIYEKGRVDLESEHSGKYIAIEVNTGEYFIADSRESAVEEARRKFPKSLVFVRRIGTIEKLSYHSSEGISKYARIL